MSSTRVKARAIHDRAFPGEAGGLLFRNGPPGASSAPRLPPLPPGLPASRTANIMPRRRERRASVPVAGYHAPVPELPDVTLYVGRLAPLVVGETLQGVRLTSPFLLRSVEPPLAAAAGRRVEAVRRLGKRIVLALAGDLFLVLHLMVAGRLRWRPAGAAIPGRHGLAAFDFAGGTLLLTEASSKKRASLQLVQGEAALAALDPGGLEVLAADLPSFRAALARESHTLKRN